MATNNQTNQTEDQTEPPKVTPIPMQAQGAVPIPESRFGERLRYAREQLGLSVEALSRLSKDEDIAEQGVSATSIARYELGDRFPGLGEFRSLCDTLQVSPQWLLYGDIGNSGRNDIEQQALLGMANWIRSLASQVDTLTLATEMQENFKKRTRLEAIAKAKKPRG